MLSAARLPRLPRRTALAAGLAGVVVVAGCDADGSADPDRTLTTGPDADEADTEVDTEGEPAGDETLVDEVVAAIVEVWRLTAGRPQLADVHRAHVEALGGDPADLPARRRTGAAVLRRREEALRADLVAAAVAAESGALARLLASMSAALAQQVVVL